jgi:hypothetical protein
MIVALGADIVGMIRTPLTAPLLVSHQYVQVAVEALALGLLVRPPVRVRAGVAEDGVGACAAGDRVVAGAAVYSIDAATRSSATPATTT